MEWLLVIFLYPPPTFCRENGIGILFREGGGGKWRRREVGKITRISEKAKRNQSYYLSKYKMHIIVCMCVCTKILNERFSPGWMVLPSKSKGHLTKTAILDTRSLLLSCWLQPSQRVKSIQSCLSIIVFPNQNISAHGNCIYSNRCKGCLPRTMIFLELLGDNL